MKNLIISIYIALIISCSTNTTTNELSFFNPDLEISVNELKSNGFTFLENWMFYQNVEGDTAYWYFCKYDQDPVLERVIDIQEWQLYDSIKINSWVESNGGKIVSNFQEKSPFSVFFVQGKTSGLISKCSLMKNHLQIQFGYPDVKNIKRSIYRDPDSGEISYEYKGIIVGRTSKKSVE